MFNFINAYIVFPYLEKKSKRLIQPKLKELREFDAKSLSEQKKIQQHELFKFLKYCEEKIPYYQNLFSQYNFKPELVLENIENLKILPELTKEIVREQTENIKTSEAYHVRKTGGSTGQSVYFYYDNTGLDWTSAINLRAYEYAKNWPHKKDCHISSELGIPFPNKKAQFLDWVKLTSQNRKRLFIHSFSDKDLEFSFQQLKAIKPYLMQGHPSSAYAIAEYIKKTQKKKKQYCKVFEPSGEMLTEKMVQSIEAHLGCKVVNRYGNAECGVMAHTRWQDPYTKLKVFNRAFYIEETEQSSLIVTSFTNYGFPLIRYNTGDVATVKTTNEGTFIFNLQGRIHDIVQINNEDYATHYIMDYLDHKIRGIREFQIHLLPQTTDVLLNIVSENEADNPRIHDELIKKWPTGLQVKFVNFEDFKKVGWQNKFRHIIDLRKG